MKTITSGMILMSMLSTVAFGAKNIYVCAGFRMENNCSRAAIFAPVLT